MSKNPRARRTYRKLAAAHFALFGFGTFAAGFRATGSVLAGVATGLLVGGAFFAVLWKLADDHYHGNVPGA